MQDKPCPSLARLLDRASDERLLGPYQLVDQLGHGGFAPVWLAREVHGKKEFRTVAIKLFCVEGDGRDARGFSTAGREQILDEARSLCQVEHPNIVRFYSFQTDSSGDVLGIVMEYARGESVDKRLRAAAKLSVAETLSLGIAVASALAAVHRVGLVHRDVKPANVIDAGGVYKLIDFGIAAGDVRSRREPTSTRIVFDDLPLDVKGTKLIAFADTMVARGDKTFAGVAAADMPSGTLGYIDPDCIAHMSRATSASDVYSLAAMLYECLAGLVPAGAAAALAGRGGLDPQVVDGRARPPPLIEIAPEVPEALAKLVDALLDPVPAKRPQRALEAQRELERIRDAIAAAPATDATETVPLGKRSRVHEAARAPRAVLPVVLAGSVVVAVFLGVWFTTRGPSAPGAASSTSSSYAPSSTYATSASATSSLPPIVPLIEPPWGVLLAEGQRRLTSGDVAGALEKMNESERQGGGAIAHAVIDHVTAATSTTGPCKLLAFSHPRLGYAHAGHTARPAIAPAPGGAVVVWGDDHERASHDHAYSVMIDTTGHPTSKTRDLTPEGEAILRPSLLAVDDRIALLYWDASGQYAGVRARWLAPDGRIAGPSLLVDPGRPGNLWPAMARTASGFVVAWQDDRNHDGDDVFLRHLDAELVPIGHEARATSVGGKDASAHTPSLAKMDDQLLVAYVLDRGQKQRLIKLRSYPLLDAGAPSELTAASSEAVALIGDAQTVPEAPQVACGKDGCFVVWHGGAGGAFVAMVDVAKKQIVWHKRFAIRGGHPALAVGPDGAIVTAFFDQGLVKVAAISGDGVNASSVIGKVSGGPPRPWIAAGREPGEWLVAWMGQEDGHEEPYAARALCR